MIVFKTTLDLEEYITSVKLSPGDIYMGVHCLFPSSGTLHLWPLPIHVLYLGLTSDGWLVVEAAALDGLDISVKLGDFSVGTAPSFGLKTLLKPSCYFSNDEGSWQSGWKCALHTWDHLVSWSPTEWYERNAPTPGELSRLKLGNFKNVISEFLEEVLVQPQQQSFVTLSVKWIYKTTAIMSKSRRKRVKTCTVLYTVHVLYVHITWLHATTSSTQIRI